MTRGVANEALRAEAVRLRVEQRLSLREIQVATGASKGSLSVWLRSHSLTEEEVVARRVRADASRVGVKRDRAVESTLHASIRGVELTRQQKGRLSETAVLLRLILQGFDPVRSPFEGARVDWWVLIPGVSSAPLKLQVKWAYQAKAGQPVVSLERYQGHHARKRMEPEDFDILAGYDLYTDTVYVWTREEVAHHKGHISVSADAAEAWHKMRSS